MKKGRFTGFARWDDYCRLCAKNIYIGDRINMWEGHAAHQACAVSARPRMAVGLIVDCPDCYRPYTAGEPHECGVR